MPDAYFFTSGGKKLPYKQGNFVPSDVVASAVVERIRVRESNDQGISGSAVKVTNPRASFLGRGSKGPSLGMGGVGQTDQS